MISSFFLHLAFIHVYDIIGVPRFRIGAGNIFLIEEGKGFGRVGFDSVETSPTVLILRSKSIFNLVTSILMVYIRYPSLAVECMLKYPKAEADICLTCVLSSG